MGASALVFTDDPVSELTVIDEGRLRRSALH
jgi:hypothetical protein